MSRPGLTECKKCSRIYRKLGKLKVKYEAEGTSCWTRNHRLLEAEAMFAHPSSCGIRRVQTMHAVNEKPFQPQNTSGMIYRHSIGDYGMGTMCLTCP